MTTIKTPGSIPENLTATHTSITTNLRIQKEQAQLARSKPTYIHDIIIQNDNQKQWDILLLPPRPPYNDGMFRLRLTFPNDYPFKPPHLRFVTPIYHPNIDEKGQMCLAILQYDNWKPGTNIESIIQSLMFLLNDPEPERPLRHQIAEQIYKDKQTFINEAIEYTKKYAEKKP
ncbi:ubiquitin-conjugating enzyme [Loa loa]|uniref:E2 ubiquitin-conjugating enzyme n=1 Tax=Loa loa TaxID=7209 RepID=A0A1S0TTB1_LOALO|nr:ubiquitin-conjugating enzyme [Loa loa]EFO19728.2 ubiquitin-conjugating enzyme [Loa loa]